MEASFHMFCVVVVCVAAFAHLAFAEDAAEGRVLFDFADEERPWRAVNDDVMGGISRGGASITRDGVLEFSGHLSLENNGGFSSIRSEPRGLGLTGFAGLVLRVKGDGRSYYLNAHTRDRVTGGSWRAELNAPEDEWAEVRVPFTEFVWTRFGRRVGRDTVDPAAIRSVGFTIADGTEGPFRLQVDWIAAHSTDGRAADLSDLVAGRDDLSTFFAAVEAAELLAALRQGTPLTVFAPTDGAFAALPEAELEKLLEPGNRTELLAVLLGHVATGRVFLRERNAGSLAGTALEVRSAGAIRVEEALVLEADIEAANGVLHVVDGIMVPETEPIDSAADAARMIETAIAEGVPLFNAGNPTLCAAIYETVAARLADADSVAVQVRPDLGMSLEAAAEESGPTERAWILRRALDEAYARLEQE